MKLEKVIAEHNQRGNGNQIMQYIGESEILFKSWLIQAVLQCILWFCSVALAECLQHVAFHFRFFPSEYFCCDITFMLELMLKNRIQTYSLLATSQLIILSRYTVNRSDKHTHQNDGICMYLLQNWIQYMVTLAVSRYMWDPREELICSHYVVLLIVSCF